MNEHQELSEKRASVYWWFSTLFIREMNVDQLQAFASEAGTALLESLGDEGMAAEIDALSEAFRQAQSSGDAQLELAADYAQTFLRDARSSALPYASVYLSDDGLLYQAAQSEMVELLQREGLAVDENLGEPADHIAVLLDYLGNLTLQGVEARGESEYLIGLDRQREFIEARLMNWLPDFVERGRKVRDAFFYPALCSLLYAYLQRERAFLAAAATPDADGA